VVQVDIQILQMYQVLVESVVEHQQDKTQYNIVVVVELVN